MVLVTTDHLKQVSLHWRCLQSDSLSQLARLWPQLHLSSAVDAEANASASVVVSTSEQQPPHLDCWIHWLGASPQYSWARASASGSPLQSALLSPLECWCWKSCLCDCSLACCCYYCCSLRLVLQMVSVWWPLLYLEHRSVGIRKVEMWMCHVCMYVIFINLTSPVTMVVSFLMWAIEDVLFEPPVERTFRKPNVTVKTSRNFSPGKKKRNI